MNLLEHENIRKDARVEIVIKIKKNIFFRKRKNSFICSK